MWRCTEKQIIELKLNSSKEIVVVKMRYFSNESTILHESCIALNKFFKIVQWQLCGNWIMNNRNNCRIVHCVQLQQLIPKWWKN